MEGQLQNVQQNTAEPQQQNTAEPQQQKPAEIDYDKLAEIVSNRQKVTEDSVIKGYLKEQGLSKEEMQSAIQAYKDNKAKNTPDIAGMQNQLAEAQAQVINSQIREQATMLALTMGIDVKSIPYVLKLADLSAVLDDGKVSEEKLTESINKVLEDLPQLKASADVQNKGFKIGGTPEPKSQVQNTKPVAQKRWNRFN